jgi:alpha-mannosidase
VSISEPGALLWAMKPAEDGIREAGVIARLWNLAAEPVDATLRLTPGPIAGATETTHIETEIGPAPVTEGLLRASLAPHQMKTYSLRMREES